MKNTKYVIPAVMAVLLGCGIMMDVSGAVPSPQYDLKELKERASTSVLPYDELEFLLKEQFNPKTHILSISGIWLEDKKTGNRYGVKLVGKLLMEYDIERLILSDNRLGALGMHELCNIIKNLPKDKLQKLGVISCGGNWIGDRSAIELLETANNGGEALTKSKKRAVLLTRLGLLSTPDDDQKKRFQDYLNDNFSRLVYLDIWINGGKFKPKANSVSKKDDSKSLEKRAQEGPLPPKELQSLLETLYEQWNRVLRIGNTKLQDKQEGQTPQENTTGVRVLGEVVGKILQKNSGPLSIELQNNWLGPKGIEEFCNILSKLPTDQLNKITCIKCEENWIGLEGAINLLIIANRISTLREAGNYVTLSLSKLGFTEGDFVKSLDSKMDFSNVRVVFDGKCIITPQYVRQGLKTKTAEEVLSPDEWKFVFRNSLDPETGTLDLSGFRLQNESDFRPVHALIEFLKDNPDIQVLVLSENYLGRRGMVEFCDKMKEILAERDSALNEIICYGNHIGPEGAIKLLELFSNTRKPIKIKLGKLEFWADDDTEERQLNDFLNSSVFKMSNVELWLDDVLKHEPKANSVDKSESAKSAQSAESAKPKGEPMVIDSKPLDIETSVSKEDESENPEDSSEMLISGKEVSEAWCEQELKSSRPLVIALKNESEDKNNMIKMVVYVARFLKKNKDKVTSLDLCLSSETSELPLNILSNALNKGTYPVVLHASTDVERANAEKVKAKCSRIEIVHEPLDIETFISKKKSVQSIESAKPEGELMVLEIKDEKDSLSMKRLRLKTKTNLVVSLDNESDILVLVGCLKKNKDMIASAELTLPKERCKDSMLTILGLTLKDTKYPVILLASTDVERTNAEKVKAKCPRVGIVYEPLDVETSVSKKDESKSVQPAELAKPKLESDEGEKTAI